MAAPKYSSFCTFFFFFLLFKYTDKKSSVVLPQYFGHLQNKIKNHNLQIIVP